MQIMEASLRRQIVAEREASLAALRQEWDGLSLEAQEERLEVAREERRRELDEEMRREVKAEVEEYKARLLQQVQ